MKINLETVANGFRIFTGLLFLFVAFNYSQTWKAVKEECASECVAYCNGKNTKLEKLWFDAGTGIVQCQCDSDFVPFYENNKSYIKEVSDDDIWNNIFGGNKT